MQHAVRVDVAGGVSTRWRERVELPAAVLVEVFLSDGNLRLIFAPDTNLNEIRAESARTLDFATPVVVVHATSASAVSQRTDFPASPK